MRELLSPYTLLLVFLTLTKTVEDENFDQLRV